MTKKHTVISLTVAATMMTVLPAVAAVPLHECLAICEANKSPIMTPTNIEHWKYQNCKMQCYKNVPKWYQFWRPGWGQK